MSGIDGYHFTEYQITCKCNFGGYPGKVTSFELIAGQPALDLVNTLDWRFRESGPEELLGGYDDLLHFTEQSGLLSQRQAQTLRRNTSRSDAVRALAQARHLREEAARIFYAIVDAQTPPADAIKKLDEYLRAAQANRTLRWASSQAELAWPSAPQPELPLWLVAQSIVDLLTSEAAGMVRECANLECRWLFLDTSRNHSRRWCDMKICGNRMKARRFKAQHKA
jgi:predicted RNA-binding Zn ribbon-like protein